MPTKNLEYLQVQIFVNIYLCIRVLVILHNEILTNMNLVEPIA
jgi:hypothetical protein